VLAAVTGAATTAPLAEVRDIEVWFGGGVQALAGVTLQIPAGTTIGIVGESGSGKTTLAKALVGLRRPTKGVVRLSGRDVYALARRERGWLSRQVQMIFQDPVSSLSPRFTIRELLAEPLRIHRLSVVEHWPRVAEMLAVLGIRPSLLDRYPHQVSGGQARRVSIARALVLEPRLIVADEPTAGLDASIQGELLNLLQQVRLLYGPSLLVVSHNLAVIRRITDQVGVMYLGKLVEFGATGRLFRAPRHPYTEALISANPIIDPAKRRHKIVLAGEIPSPRNPPSGCRFHTRCPRAQVRCHREEPSFDEIAPGQHVACFYPVSWPSSESSSRHARD
jgi:oligopeptide transport system ATP-binding protein